MAFSRFSSGDAVRGFSLVEALLALSVFGILTTGLAGTLVAAQYGGAGVVERSSALLAAREGLAAVRQIRDVGEWQLRTGEFGLERADEGWILTDTPEAAAGMTRTIRIDIARGGGWEIYSSVSWRDVSRRDRELTLMSTLTDWRRTETKPGSGGGGGGGGSEPDCSGPPGQQPPECGQPGGGQPGGGNGNGNNPPDCSGPPAQRPPECS